jgi:transglutaminase-like putative cysteine protease
MRFISRLATTLALAAAAAGAWADSPAHAYLDKIRHTTYDIDADGRSTRTAVHRYQVLAAGKLEDYKVYTLGYSSSIETGEVLEAYTLKKDGRRIPVPKGNYQRQVNEGRRGAGPAFSDRTKLTVVFPDLAVGDSVHIRYRIAEKEPMFPGQFSEVTSYSLFAPVEDARITIRAPKGMQLRTEAHRMQAVAEREEGGKRVLEWRYANPKPRSYVEEEDSGHWKMGEYPALLVSTFQTYEAIARAYGDRALPKAVPTPRVRELVAQVVGTEAQPREKARKLYEWVSRNITYGGNCIGVGAVVPRDVDFVLDNKMGDCKDHATLLQAMLAAAGVRSEQVLINSGSDYELPATPVVSMVNHVMTYLPDFKLYADATAKEIPFGYLPRDSYGKPVIHVGAATALAAIPAEDHRRNEQRLHMKVAVAPDGSATGTMTVTVKGADAQAMRAYLREVTAETDKDIVKRALAAGGMRGKGKIVRGDMQGFSDQLEMRFEFEAENFLRPGATGALYFMPVAGTPHGVGALSDAGEGPEPKRAGSCYGFHSWETLEYEFPPGMELLAMPADLKVQTPLIDYTATHVRNGTRVTVQREVHDKTPVSFCTAQMHAEFHRLSRPIGENLRTQVLYKRAAH